MHISSKHNLIAMFFAMLFPVLACADGTDAEARIRELEKQLQVISQELTAMQQQMANTKEEKIKEKGKSEGSPVYAAFKDGLVFEDSSSDWKMQFNGRVQTDYREYDPNEWQSDTFSIRRARLGGTFTFLKDYTLRVEAEYANTTGSSTTALTYGYLNFGRWKGVNIRLGQFKPFFGLERSDSTNFTDFTELSLATNNGTIFNSTYDRGLMVFGNPLTWFNYNVYVVNGTGQNTNDVNNLKDIGGRINANFAEFTDIKNAVLHVGASASKGNLGFSSDTGNISQRTESLGATFFGVSGLETDNDRKRWGLETALVYGPVKLQSEYIHANFDGNSSGGRYNNDIKNWYVDLNWLITGEAYADSYKNGVFGRINPKHNFDDKGGWGAFELGLRYSKFDASDFKNMLSATALNGTTVFTSEADAWTAGAKWILNPNARILLNYVHTVFDTPITVNDKTGDDEDALILRAQYDF